MNSFVFDVIVYMIFHRFRAINEMIRQLNEKLAAYWIALKIRKIRRLHNGTYNIYIICRMLASFLAHKFRVSDISETEHTSF